MNSMVRYGFCLTSYDRVRD